MRCAIEVTAECSDSTRSRTSELDRQPLRWPRWPRVSFGLLRRLRRHWQPASLCGRNRATRVGREYAGFTSRAQVSGLAIDFLPPHSSSPDLILEAIAGQATEPLHLSWRNRGNHGQGPVGDRARCFGAYYRSVDSLVRSSFLPLSSMGETSIPLADEDGLPHGFLLERMLTYPREQFFQYSSGFEDPEGFAGFFVAGWVWISSLWLERESSVMLHHWRSTEGVLCEWATVLAEQLGVTVRTDARHEADACLVETRRSATIWLSAGLSRQARAWVTLHELAHYVLDHEHNTEYSGDPSHLTPARRLAFERQEFMADCLASIWSHLFEGLMSLTSALFAEDSANPEKVPSIPYCFEPRAA